MGNDIFSIASRSGDTLFWWWISGHLKSLRSYRGPKSQDVKNFEDEAMNKCFKEYRLCRICNIPVKYPTATVAHAMLIDLLESASCSHQSSEEEWSSTDCLPWPRAFRHELFVTYIISRCTGATASASSRLPWTNYGR